MCRYKSMAQDGSLSHLLCSEVPERTDTVAELSNVSKDFDHRRISLHCEFLLWTPATKLWQNEQSIIGSCNQQCLGRPCCACVSLEWTASEQNVGGAR